MRIDIRPETYERLFQLAQNHGLAIDEYLEKLAASSLEENRPVLSSFYTDLHKSNKERSFDKPEDAVAFIRTERDKWN